MASRWLSSGQSAWGLSSDEGPSSKKMMVGVAALVFLVGGMSGYLTRLVTADESGRLTESAFRNSVVIEPSLDSVTSPAKTSDGAVRAVTSFITGFPSASLRDDTEQARILDQIVAPNADPNLRTDLRDTMVSAREQLLGTSSFQKPLTARLVMAPATYRVEMIGSDRARVQVWFLSVLVDSDGQRAQSTWATNDVQVVWTDHWRITSFAARGGPTPTLYGASQEPSSFNEVVEMFNGFQAYRYAVTPPTAK